MTERRPPEWVATLARTCARFPGLEKDLLTQLNISEAQYTRVLGKYEELAPATQRELLTAIAQVNTWWGAHVPFLLREIKAARPQDVQVNALWCSCAPFPLREIKAARPYAIDQAVRRVESDALSLTLRMDPEAEGSVWRLCSRPSVGLYRPAHGQRWYPGDSGNTDDRYVQVVDGVIRLRVVYATDTSLLAVFEREEAT